jgi:hypothetical protein
MRRFDVDKNSEVLKKTLCALLCTIHWRRVLNSKECLGRTGFWRRLQQTVEPYK